MRLYDVFRIRVSAKHLAIGWACAGALAGPQVAHAVEWNKATDYMWSASTGKVDVFPGQGTGNVWATGTKQASAAGPTFSATKALPFNPSPTFSFKATFTPANMAKAITRPIGPLLLGAALSELASLACTRLAGGTMTNTGSTGWEECNMVSQNQVQYRGPAVNNSYTAWFSSPGAACQASSDNFRANQLAGNPAWSGIMSNFITNNGSWYGCTVRSNFPGSTTYSIHYNNSLIQTQNASVLVQDGWKPATDAVVEPKIIDKLTQWSQADYTYGTNKSLSALDEIINSGNSVQVNTVTATGQNTIVGSPVTTTTTETAPDGSTVTKTETKTTTNTYTPTATGSNVSVTHTQVTNTQTSSTNNTTNQTTTTNSTSTNNEPPPTEDMCKANPQIAACAKLDTPTEDVPKRTENLSYVAENLGFGGGSCPAPIGWSDSLGSHSIDLAPLCDKLTGVVRPLVIAFALLAAVFIVMPGKTEA